LLPLLWWRGGVLYRSLSWLWILLGDLLLGRRSLLYISHLMGLALLCKSECVEVRVVSPVLVKLNAEDNYGNGDKDPDNRAESTGSSSRLPLTIYLLIIAIATTGGHYALVNVRVEIRRIGNSSTEGSESTEPENTEENLSGKMSPHVVGNLKEEGRQNKVCLDQPCPHTAKNKECHIVTIQISIVVGDPPPTFPFR